MKWTLRLYGVLFKVLVDKGEGKGIGWGIEMVGTVSKTGPRAKWNTEQTAKREELIFTKVIGIQIVSKYISS